MIDYKPLEGTKDILPDQYKYLTFLKKVFRHEFRKNGFRRITTPLMESKEIIDQVFGDQKYNYCETELGFLRGHSAVGIFRAYLDNEFANEIQPVYSYYMDNYFSMGEEGYSEIEKIGAEIIGENDPILDAILTFITYSILNKINLKDTFSIRINSVGIEKEKVKYKEELVSFYENKKHILSEKSLKNLELNPMLLLSSQGEDEKILAQQAPSIIKFLKKDSKAHYEQFKEYLDILKVPYIEDHTLVGPYDFNTNSIWEFRTIEGDKQIARGSRHNALSTKFGETKEIPATGFFADTEVLIDMLKSKKIKIKNKDRIDLYFVQLGDEAKKVILPLSIEAREAGINTVLSLGTPSMKEQMLKATRSGAKYIVMVGIMEARNGVFQLRNNVEGTQEEIKKEDLINYIIGKIGIKSLDFYCPARDLINEGE